MSESHSLRGPALRALATSLFFAIPMAAGCSDGGAPADSGLPSDHHLSKVEFPLFENFAAERDRLLSEREAAGKPESALSAEIPFAQSFDEAFERAAREDKPVLIATFVRENGDPHCDV